MGRQSASHVPTRQCRVCRQRAPKSSLERWVVSLEGPVRDNEQIMPGRGWYLCNQPQCQQYGTQAIQGQARKRN